MSTFKKVRSFLAEALYQTKEAFNDNAASAPPPRLSLLSNGSSYTLRGVKPGTLLRVIKHEFRVYPMNTNKEAYDTWGDCDYGLAHLKFNGTVYYLDDRMVFPRYEIPKGDVLLVLGHCDGNWNGIIVLHGETMCYITADHHSTGYIELLNSTRQ